jgi:hypothetical protein
VDGRVEEPDLRAVALVMLLQTILCLAVEYATALSFNLIAQFAPRSLVCVKGVVGLAAIGLLLPWRKVFARRRP